MEWRRIPGFHRYEVSADGRVRCWHTQARARTSLPTPRVLRGEVDRFGYKRFKLVGDDGVKRCGLGAHVLVLLAFVGPAPAGTEGSHLNGDKADNRVGNLAWETPAENSARRVDHGTLPMGEAHGRARFCEGDVRAIRVRASSGETYAAIARDYSTHRNTVRSIVNRRTWGHVA